MSIFQAATLDLDRMRLVADGLRLDMSLEADTALALQGADAGTYAVTVDGAEAGEITVDDGVLALSLPAATATVVLRRTDAPAAAAPPAGPVAAPALPATGGTALLPAALMLLVAGMAARGRVKGRARG